MSGDVELIGGVLETAEPPLVENAGRDASSASAKALVEHGAAGTDGVGDGSPACLAEVRGPRRVNPDDGRFIRLVVGGVVIAGVVAFAISFTALYEVAEWLGLPPFMWWAVPVFIDLAILVYAASVLVHKARGEQTLASWAALATFTALSVFANAAHAWAYGQGHDQAWQAVVGAVIAGMVPVAIFVATEQLSRVAVEDPTSRRTELRDQTRTEQARAEHARHVVRLRFEQEKQEREIAHERVMAERAAELNQERHQTAIATLQARRELEVGQATQSGDVDHSPDKTPHDDIDPEPGVAAPQQGPSETGPRTVASESSIAATSGPVALSDLDEIAEFVADQIAAGAKVSARTLVERFGLTERTARRRLQWLREKRPEVFNTPAPESWRDLA